MPEFNDGATPAPAPTPVAEAVAEVTGTDIALLAPPARAAIVLKSKTRETELRALVLVSKDIKEIKNADGREQVHRMAMNLRNARTGLENEGKKIREDSNAFSKAVIGEVTRLVAITADEEKRVFDIRDGYDNEQKRIAAEKALAEAKRIDGHKETIGSMRALPVDLVAATSEDIQTEIDALADLTAQGFTSLEEFAAEALTVAAEVSQTLRVMHAGAAAREQAEKAIAEANARLAEQQAELARKQEELDAKLAALEPPKPEPIIDPAAGLAGAITGAMSAGTTPAGWESVEGEDLPASTVTVEEVPENMDTMFLDENDPKYGVDPDPALRPDLRDDLPEVTRTTHTVPSGFSEAGLARVAAAVSAPLTWEVLGFEGYGYSVFGEYLNTGDDHDSGKGFANWTVEHPDVPGGVLVTGTYIEKGRRWVIAVGALGEDADGNALPLPNWRIWLDRGEYDNTPRLCIEAPSGFILNCLERANAG